MKLLNQSILYLSVFILFIISIWAVIFYFSMLDEIKESVDEGLEHYKRQIIYKARTDSSILSKHHFDEGFFSIQEINQSQALATKDHYIDTMMYMQDADDLEEELEPVRMLVTAFENNKHYYKLSIINSMIEEDDLVKELFRDALWLYFMLITSIIIVNNVVLKRLWKPFYNFLNQLKNYKLGISKKLPEVSTNTKEFTDLQQAVNTLLNHSVEAFEQQKQFIGNASHELQTPLAIATNKLELLLEKGNLEERQAGSIAEVLQMIERLVRLNKSLLLLTQIENKQFLNNQKVHFNRIAQETVNDLEEYAAFKNVQISIEETAELYADMDPSMAGIVVSNLIRNAIFHNVENGSVSITISEKECIIRNTGKNASLDAEKIFNRFYKSDTAQTGTGLGLAIVKAICNLYKLSVSYRFENNQHRFCLHFNNL